MARRIDGWGFEGQGLPPSSQMLSWLHERLGPAGPGIGGLDRAKALPAPGALPELPRLSTDDLDRLAHSRGRGTPDLIRLRTGTVPRLPDGVVRPLSSDEVEAILARCSEAGVRVVPFGGGTSVTGGLNLSPSDPRPAISLDLERLAGLESIDPTSRLATFGAGTPGPAVERALAGHGFTLGHFPQSFELSTVGGWIAARASGQESIRYGSMRDLLAGAELIAPAGRLEIPALPNSASGPDLREWILGSEGRFGVITRATLRVHPTAPLSVRAAILPSFAVGAQVVRRLAQTEAPLGLLRLSDEPETEVAIAIGLSKHRAVEPLVRRWFRFRGIEGAGCLMLYGASGDEAEVERGFAAAQPILREHGAVSLGAAPGKKWLKDRFRHPYLRDGLLDRGYATDTLETAAPWSRLHLVYEAVGRAIRDALSGERVAVLCHLSHPYLDGCSLYFTFFYRNPSDPDEALERWAAIKRAASEAIASAGAAASHHHGVGTWHAPWYPREVGALGVELVRAVAARLDPRGVVSPGVLLDPADRLLE